MSFRIYEKANRLNASDSVAVDRSGSTTGSTLVSQLLDRDNHTGTLAVASGGTGGTDAATARTNLGLGTIATQDADSVSITGGSITGFYVEKATKAHYLEDDVRKASVGTIVKGRPVYIADYNPSGFVEVEECDADDHGTLPCQGLAGESITNAADAEIIIAGKLEGWDTSSWSAGAVLWVASGGGLTDTEPAGAVYKQAVAVVLRSHATLGAVFVLPSGQDIHLPNFAIYAQKAAPVAGDRVIIEDSEDSYAKKYALKSAMGLADVVDDTSPQLGGSLDVNANKIVSVSDGDIDIEPNGTGNVLLGNFTFDADQTVGAGQDNYVLTYDDGAGTIALEAAAASGLADVVDDTTPQLGGSLDVNGQAIVSVSDGDIALSPDGTGVVVVTNGALESDVADGASAEAFVLDTANALSTSGSQLLSIKNNSAEKAYLDKDGNFWIAGNGSGVKLMSVSGSAEYLGIGNGIYLNSSPVSNSSVRINQTGIHYGAYKNSDFEIAFDNPATDYAPNTITLTARAALPGATVNIGGAACSINGGAGASSSAGDADGGAVNVTGGAGYGTGDGGSVVLRGGTANGSGADGEIVADGPMRGMHAVLNAQTGTTYTVTASDAGKIVTLSNASAITLTLPETSTESLPEGFQCTLIQRGAGQVTVAKEGSDTIESKDSNLSLTGQHSIAYVTKLAAGSPNTWGLYGDLTT